MFSLDRSSRYGRWSIAVLTGVLFLAWGFSQDLSISVGGAVRKLSAVDHNGTPYYSLDDIAQLLNLSLTAARGRVMVAGSRGTLILQSGRPLVRTGEQYVLLGAPCWERRQGQWYVPVDFLKMALPTILNERMTQTGNWSFQIELVRENTVRVETLDYPDHLSIVFRMSRPADVEVREFHDYIDVAYMDSLVRPATIDLPVSQDIVSGISFEAQEALGTFRIRKGPAFLRFQHLMLNNPPRLVLDVYGVSEPTVVSPSDGRPADSGAGAGVVSPSDQTIGAQVPTAARRVRQEGLVVVDAGHGAEDYGVDSHQEVLEKVLALELAQKVEHQLRADQVPMRLTRTRDVSIALDQRAAVANFYQASVFVTIHLGSAPTPGIRGPMVYILSAPEEKGEAETEDEKSSELAALLKPWSRAQDPYIVESRRLAHLMQSRLNELFESENLVTEAPLAELEPIEAPAILIETGFLTNPQDLSLLGTPEFRDQLAAAIADTLARFTRTQ